MKPLPPMYSDGPDLLHEQKTGNTARSGSETPVVPGFFDEEDQLVGRRVGMVVMLACPLFVIGCSGDGGQSAAPAIYSGDLVSDFVIALQNGDAAKARELLKVDSAILELRDEIGQSPLHYAVLSNSAALVELLIDEGIDPNVKDNEGRTPLTVLEDAGLRLDSAREALVNSGGTN